MLQYLHVKNLALIDEIEIDFQKGLNILTGETGAGKSIILGSINLALGGKYSKDMLRTGTQFGLVELVFSIENEKIEKILNELDIFSEDGQIILSRKLMEGRSISKVNGETVNMKTLRDVASLLIDIHGQHEHQSLLNKKNHLMILDAFAKEDIAELKKKTAEAYHQFTEARVALEESKLDEESRRKEVSLLEFETKEIEEASLASGEDEVLEEKYRFMLNGKKVSEAVLEGYQYTSGQDGENASELLGRTLRCMQQITDYDKKAEELFGQLSEIDSLLNDFNRELSDYSKSLEFSEEEFYETETRLNEINHLKTKYGNSVDEILGYYEEKTKELEKFQDYDAYVAGLERKYEQTLKELEKASTSLSKKRKSQAKTLVSCITEVLKDLNFLDVQFEMQFERTKDFTAGGIDDAQFYISANPGEALKPLNEVASGGELSRIMLAIKTVMSDRDDTPTLIFDEIDAGISGITAEKVAEKMNIIGRNRQVICITHLPQIAAMADTHYVIRKEVEKQVTKTRIFVLSEEESIAELTRILGGSNVTEHMIQSAKEMKEMAKRTK
ncbi:MAG: DNA repair protein RecN [Hespellia sp.]|nr:DNA repair protein RecN [Hespellia sp.]